MFVNDIAEKLNKTREQVIELCNNKGIKVYNIIAEDSYIRNEDGEKLLVQEIKTPTRYTKHGRECKDIIKDVLGSEGLQHFYIGNIIKYIYRNQTIGDLEKAKTYIEMLIKEVQENDCDNE